MHVNLKTIVKIDRVIYTEEENRYLHHPWTHLDFVVFNKYDKIPILAIEVDGISTHDQNEKQSKNDRIKDKCLKDCGLPLIRLKTNQSNEKQRIINELNMILNTM